MVHHAKVPHRADEPPAQSGNRRPGKTVDPVIASALLTAPPFLSDLADAELAMVWHKVEQHASPEIIEARAATARALKEDEQGHQRLSR